MTSMKSFNLLCTLVLFITYADCLQETGSNQLHRSFSEMSQEYGFGLREIAVLVTGVIFGILCFLCIMYNFKWRRESGWDFTFTDLFKDYKKSNPQDNSNESPKKQSNSFSPTKNNNKYQNKNTSGFENNQLYPSYPHS